MTNRKYYAPRGALPPQTAVMTDHAVFTEAHAVIPKGVMTDIVTSALPHWTGTRSWILGWPLSAFAETFAQYIVEILPGGSDKPEPDADWVEVEAGDFMWPRAFCPQGSYAAELGPFRYLLYKDVNRHPRLEPVVG